MKFFKKKDIDKTKIAYCAFHCPIKWESMTGDGDVRFCEECKHKVYDLRGLTEEEILRFVELEEGEVCGLASYDRSGRIVNGKCTKGSVQKVGKIGTKKFTVDEDIDQRVEKAEKRLKDLKALEKLIKEKET